MREIKFRAWDAENKWMNYATLDELRKWFGSEYGFPYGVQYFAEGEKPIMQYTGLKDKNGVEIYEGDIVFGAFGGEERPRQGVIEYATDDVFPDTGAHESAYATGFHILYSSRCDIYHQGLAYTDEIEVIGNIYQNNKLLK